MFPMMNNRITSSVLIAVLLVVAVSGCAALKLQPTGEIGGPLDAKPESVEMQFGMARMLERKGKLTEAREAYEKILDSQPHPQSLHRLGVTEIRQNRLDDGLQHLSEAVAAGEASAELLGDLGYAQFLSDDLTAAEETLRKAVALDPSEKRNVNNLAIVVGKQDRLKESFQLFRQAGPEAEALANLAFVQSQSEKLDKAKENYNKALDLDPQLKIAAVGLLEVDKYIKVKSNVPKTIEPKTIEPQTVEPQTIEPDLKATPTVRRASWNQPATSRTPLSYPSEASDRVLAKIISPDSVPVETNGESNKEAGRDTEDATASQKELAKQDLLSSIAQLIDDADGAIEFSEIPKN